MTRSEAREEMMKVIFQLDANNQFDLDYEDEYLDELDLKKHEDYSRKVFALVCENIKEIDQRIYDNCRNWELARMPKTDLAILRLACVEICYMEDIPNKVSVNEAVELAKKYSEDSSPAYINGILGGIIRGIS